MRDAVAIVSVFGQSGYCVLSAFTKCQTISKVDFFRKHGLTKSMACNAYMLQKRDFDTVWPRVRPCTGKRAGPVPPASVGRRRATPRRTWDRQARQWKLVQACLWCLGLPWSSGVAHRGGRQSLAWGLHL